MKRAIALLVLALGLAQSAAGAAPSDASNDVPSLRRQAVALSSQGQYQQASQLYERIAQLQPGDPESAKDWMWTLWYSKQYERTIEIAGRVVAGNPKDLDALNLLGQAQLAAGRRREALETYLKSETIFPNQIPVRRALARIYENLKDYARALDYVRGLLKDQPSDAGLYAQLARIEFYQGHYGPSAAAWDKAANLQPKETDYKLGLARALYFAGNTERAVLLSKEILADEPHNWATLDFLVAVSSMTRDFKTAYAAMETSLKDVPPQDEPRLLRLAGIYAGQGMDDKFMATLNRALRLDPNNVEALLAKAQYWTQHGRAAEAAKLYEAAARLNPNSIKAWTGRAGILYADSQFHQATQVIERARRLDPTDPYLLVLHALYLEDEDRAGATKMLFQWMQQGERSALPILLYHGITAREHDPQLASPMVLSTAAFDEHMRALRDAGFDSITAKDAAAWFREKTNLSSKPVLITFDDPRADTLRSADPILRKYGFKATVFVSASNIDNDLPGFPSWEDLERYQKSGRWEIGSYGNLSNARVPLDADGRTGMFLPNKRWLEGEKRLETDAEWSERVRSDHESAKRNIREHLGGTPIAYAFPEGDYGQQGAPNFAESAPRSLELCRASYALCLHQGTHGINVRSRDPALAARVEPRRDWTGEHFLQELSDGNPYVFIHRVLARFYEHLKEYPNAIRYYLELLKDQPKDPAVYAQIARAQFYIDLYDESVASWDEALRLAPDNVSYKLNKAKSLYFMGREESAVRLIREVIASQPQNWGAVDFLVGVSSITGDVQTSYTTLEVSLKDVAPVDEPRLLHLAEIYSAFGMGEQFLATLDRALESNPSNGAALLGKADYFASHGNLKEARKLYRRVAELNPHSIVAWAGLADALSASSQTVRAVRAMEHAIRLDPTDPFLLLTYSRYLYDNGNRALSKNLLRRWLEENEEVTLPVLLYHGITPFQKDPMLAATIHLTTTTFDSQMRALHDAGYTPVTVQQAVAWFERKAELPPKPILITFDDARLDSLRYADPILEKYGLKATMFAQLYNVNVGPPGYANWAELAHFQKGGRWDIQAHGDLGHTHIQVDADGRQGMFIPNKRWLASEKRLETDAEWSDRIRSDEQSCKRKIQEHVGAAPVAFAFPEGDYGEEGAPNFPDSARLNIEICRAEFAVCFHQDSHGINVRTRDPALATRVEPQQSWTGEALLKHLTENNPFLAVRRDLLARSAWDRDTREAFHWLEEARRTGASAPVLLAGESRIRFSAGDRTEGLALAQQALQLEDSPDTHRLMDSIHEEMRVEWTPSVSYYRDNRDRKNLSIEQTIGPWAMGNTLLHVLPLYATYRETGLETITDKGGGVQVTQPLGLYHALVANAAGHSFAGGPRNTYSAFGVLRSRWADSFETELSGGRALYQTARALDANVRDRYLGLTAVLDLEDSWRASLQTKGSNLTDGNRRYTGTFRITRPFVAGGALRAAYQFTADSMDRVSPDYYSPRHLTMHQFGPNYYVESYQRFRIDIRYMPGFGSEEGTRRQFIQELDAEFHFELTPRLFIGLSASLTRTPTYRGDTYTFAPTYRF